MFCSDVSFRFGKFYGTKKTVRWRGVVLVLMAEILHQLICSFSHDLQGFIYPSGCLGFLWISSINSRILNYSKSPRSTVLDYAKKRLDDCTEVGRGAWKNSWHCFFLFFFRRGSMYIHVFYIYIYMYYIYICKYFFWFHWDQLHFPLKNRSSTPGGIRIAQWEDRLLSVVLTFFSSRTIRFQQCDLDILNIWDGPRT